MAPLIKALEQHPAFESVVVVTAQHREMLDQVLELFRIQPDYDLNIMKPNQSLFDITAGVLQKLEKVFGEIRPDMVLVHGDTTTTFAASLAAYYQQIPVAHIEAGLRSGDLYSPFPEEANRKLTGVLATLHFAPTAQAKDNLLAEGISNERIFVTGNTVIDALLDTVAMQKENKSKKNINFPCELPGDNAKMILVTAHRRENHGKPLADIFAALQDIHNHFSNVQIVFPVHKNPKVRELSESMLRGMERIHLLEPMEYAEFSFLMSHSDLVLTDSGGIQEEAPALGKPVLVLRENTERPEAIAAGTAILVGTDRKKIFETVKELLTQQASYEKMAKAINPYGDGKASRRILQGILFFFDKTKGEPDSWEY